MCEYLCEGMSVCMYECVFVYGSMHVLCSKREENSFFVLSESKHPNSSERQTKKIFLT